MKKMFAAALLAALSFSIHAADEVVAPAIAASAPETAASAVEPADSGLTIRNDELSLAYAKKTKASLPDDLVVFRPNPNMPEVTKEFLADQLAGKGTATINGYFPALVMLPCADCNKSDYKDALAAFSKAYNKPLKNGFKHRGEIRVRIIKAYSKLFINPMDHSSFAIEFAFEGKRVVLGERASSRQSLEDVARSVGETLMMEIAMRAGSGLKPVFLKELNMDSSLNQASMKLSNAMQAIDDVLSGSGDIRPRLEPMTDAHKDLLPAVDGINPNEYRPVNGRTNSALTL